MELTPAQHEMHSLAHDWNEMTGSERGVSWLVSAVVHLVVFLGFAWWWSPPRRGVELAPDRDVGIVLVGEVDGRLEYFTQDHESGAGDGASNSDGSTGTVQESIATSLPAGDRPPVDPTGVLPSGPAPGAGVLGSGVLPSANELTRGGSTGSAAKVGANKGHTYLFGAKGVGNTFLYLFDRSASMEGYGGRPLAAAKAELAKSIAQLQTNHQFQIIFYNDRQTVFNPYYPQSPRLLFADEKHRDLADRYIRSVTADGGTRHLDALKMALGLNPDVLFFLTDADEPQLTSSELADIARRRGGTVIHAIEFGAGPQRNLDNFLVRLAKMTDGEHVYIDLTQLPRP